jgi:hypothetical protein
MGTSPHGQTRISNCKDVVKSLTAELAVPAYARRLIAVRLRDNNADLEQPIRMLRFRTRLLTCIGCLMLSLSSVVAALMLQGGSGVGFSGASLFVATLALAAGTWQMRSWTSSELWLRTHVAQLGLATELLELAHRHSVVRTYLESALQLYDAPRGLDVLLARKLAGHDYAVRPSGKAQTEQVAMRGLLDLPYLNEM